jgi:PiT family inorganic phosphate transporter
MSGMDTILVAGIGLALFFTFLNGLNDAANSVAVIVATRALSPLRAVGLAAAGNLIGPFVLTTAIAKTIGTGIVDPDYLTPVILVTALLSAIIFVIAATRLGFPVSSSHALVGGLIGAGIAAFGPSVIIVPPVEMVKTALLAMLPAACAGALIAWVLSRRAKEDPRIAAGLGALIGASVTVPLLILSGTFRPEGILAIVLFIVISPMLGFFAAFVLDVVISHLFRYSNQPGMRRIFQPLQVVAAGVQSVGHGANDGQNAVGMITALLVAGGVLGSFSVPDWVILLSAIAMAAGTFFGGWEVIVKIAKKITKIRPYQGFSASASGGAVLSAVTVYGIPVSSTHVISGAIVGVGVTRGLKAVQWDVVREIIITWITTIPLALVIAYIIYPVIRLVSGFL